MVAETFEFDSSAVDLDLIELPEGDDFGIPSDEDDDAEVAAELQPPVSGFGNVIVADNVPVVGPEKQAKLASVLRKIFSQCGKIAEQGLYMPISRDTEHSQGYVFIEFSNEDEANVARQHLDGYKLDKSHIFRVNAFDDFARLEKVTEEFVPPPPKTRPGSGDLHMWLLDDRGRDQFVIRYGDATEVFWNDAKSHGAELVYSRAFWTESFVQWSPLGHYLATMHRQGVAIWGGAEFTRRQRFSHSYCQLLDFSPGERYIVSMSQDKNQIIINIFDTRSAKLMRSFKGLHDEFLVGAASAGGQLGWPVFKWANDTYFARISKNGISVYETPTMGLLDKKSLKIEGVHDFCWSPSKLQAQGSPAMLSVYVPESASGNQPARVTIYEIPSRKELRQKNLFSVETVKMIWHPQGDYLAAIVTRFTKTRKSTYSGFELFLAKERDLPVEVFELENKSEKVIDFAWEPRGHRFAVIHGDGPRPDVSIYSVKDDKGNHKIRKLGTLKGKTANQLFWSPAGRHLVIAGLKSMNGQLEFFDADEMATMEAAEHFMCTDVEWDPSGRYFATAVTAVHQMENGFNIWSFQGKLLFRSPRERFFQFLWRPRPPSLIEPAKEKEIAKSLKKYSKQFDEEDELLKSGKDREVLAERRGLLEEWKNWMADRQAIRDQEREERIRLRDGVLSDDEGERVKEEIFVEELLDETEEVLDSAQL